MKSILLTITVICTSLLARAQQKQPVYLDLSQPIERRVENALSLMTTEEKVSLCYAQSKFSSKGVPRLGIPEVWTDDGPHGIREEVLWDEWGGAGWTNDSCTAFPALTCLAASFNPKLSLLYGQSIGEEARYRNKTVLLGPGVNIYRTPLNGRNFEYMGEDPYLSSRMVIPYIQGVQSNGVAACVKHFALNNQEEWRGHINVDLSDRALNEIYLPAFKAAVQEAKAWSIMGSYNQFRGQHCCHNDLLLNKILKKDWAFDGVVISDWGGVHNTDEAVNNGLDLEMGTYTDGLTTKGKFPYSSYYLANPFLKGIKEGKYDITLLDDKARRILRLIFRTTMSQNRPFGRFVSPEHSEAARKIAQEGIVLLKNENKFFPVPSGKFKKIAVIGENADRSLVIGGGSSSLKVAYEKSPLDGLIAKYGKDHITYSLGYASGPALYGREEPSKLNADSLINAAVEVAKQADIVFFIGGLNKNHFQDCEGGDRKSFSLPFGQDKLIDALFKANKNTAVVLLSGNAVSMPWINKVPAIMQGWYLGSEAGNALADVISGEVNPSGKLPFSFPKKLEDNAAHFYGKISYPGDSINQFYKEDILVGYRWFDTKKISPQFSFGYGLSYTSFDLGPLSSDKKLYSKSDTVRISFTVKNTGAKYGAEVVQLYVHDPVCTVTRPVKELKAFEKVFLKPGETKTVEVRLKVADLAFYDETKKNWNVEAGDFILQLGNSSSHISQKLKITVR
ncbi:beta-glucosidase [Pedobacter sp. AK013]|uniref:beta-glucosidase n=1 Tax=Pedobacter sp. AK013 TaxID=2723071 RepID=UPI00160EC705|nr:glycoside hydrolase family 3 C-terminal domain-containing protein [Pedobacter sp. AK013]MBB6239618.1 beta-glucosidase [Pedobacter sp. AK013]